MASKSPLRTIAVSLVVLSAIAGFGSMWYASRAIESTDNAYVHGEVTTISPRVAGYVTEVAAADNQGVTSGQVLVRIDDADYRARLQEADAAVGAARAALNSYDTRLSAQDMAIAEAAAGVAEAEADLSLARKDLARIEPLARSDFASRQRLDTARSGVSKAIASLDSAKAKLAAAKSQLAVIAADRVQQEARIQQAEAQAEAARINLANTVIRAPLNGIVGNRGVRVGQYVTPGSHLLAVVPLDQVWIEANFKETQIGEMRQGQRVTITVDAFPDTPVDGYLGSISPASGSEFSLLPPENASGNFTKIVQRVPVRIELPADNPLAGRLRPGLSVDVAVDTASPPAPSDALAATRP